MAHGEPLDNSPPWTGGLKAPKTGPWDSRSWGHVPGSGHSSGPGQPGEGEVHLWWKALERIAGGPEDRGVMSPGDENVLSWEERARVRRFRRGADARSWAEGRVWVRTVLGAYLNRSPSQVTFGFGPEGKPFVTGPGKGLEFNLSHTGDRIVLAVAQVAVGIDIEKMASEELALELEGEVFFGKELDLLQSMEKSLRRELFYSGWVRKEALVKATGKGLSLPLRSFRVLDGWKKGRQPVSFSPSAGSEFGVGPGAEAGAPAIEEDFRGFSLWDFSFESEVLGAVAVGHSSPTFFCWSWVD